ncbi:MAG: ice-binding family protein [Actinomycetota bacterium]|nr:DUF3494 domain-containing protein [Actinomycetota bacterium]
MKIQKTAVVALVLVVLMAAPAQANHIATVGLGTAGSFAVLAGSGITNAGATVVKGDLGSHPNGAVTGFPPGTVQNGTINPSYTAGAKDALVTAYNDAAGRTPVTTIATELGGQNLKHGVYNSVDGTFQITGTLTLDAEGDPNAVWIFKTASTLITASNSNVVFVNGGSQCNIFWQVGSSATLGTNSTLRGNIFALASITLNTGASLFGRALARNAAVTLDTNTIDASGCLAAPPSGAGTTTPNGTRSTRRRSRVATATTSTGALPRTGGRLPLGPTTYLGISLILVGILYNFLGTSSTKLAIAARGYEPRRKARRWG